MNPPIGVFAYNRPAHLRACLEAIMRSEALLGKQLPLYIFCDLQKTPKDEEQVAATIAVAEEFGRGTVVVREKNYGFHNITEGISNLCDTYEQAIIIEDDVLMSPDFLPFICSALEKYRNDPRVFMVSGFMYFGAKEVASKPLFLNPAFIWGWATWKRAWDHYSWDAPGWQEFVKDKRKCYSYDCLGSIPFSKHLRKTLTGEWTAWAPQWAYTMEKAGGLALYPHRSLVWNCGCGGGTHGNTRLNANPRLGEREMYIHGTMEFEDFKSPRLPQEVYEGKCFPSEVEVDKKALRRLALIFLQERLQTETRKRWRLYLKLFFHKIASLI